MLAENQIPQCAPKLLVGVTRKSYSRYLIEDYIAGRIMITVACELTIVDEVFKTLVVRP